MTTKLKMIDNMTKDEALNYLKAIHQSTMKGRERELLIQACEARIDSPNISDVLVVVSKDD